jgi:hypothetical protein
VVIHKARPEVYRRKSTESASRADDTKDKKYFKDTQIRFDRNDAANLPVTHAAVEDLWRRQDQPTKVAQTPITPAHTPVSRHEPTKAHHIHNTPAHPPASQNQHTKAVQTPRISEHSPAPRHEPRDAAQTPGVPASQQQPTRPPQTRITSRHSPTSRQHHTRALQTPRIPAHSPASKVDNSPDSLWYSKADEKKRRLPIETPTESTVDGKLLVLEKVPELYRRERQRSGLNDRRYARSTDPNSAYKSEAEELFDQSASASNRHSVVAPIETLLPATGLYRREKSKSGSTENNEDDYNNTHPRKYAGSSRWAPNGDGVEAVQVIHHPVTAVWRRTHISRPTPVRETAVQDPPLQPYRTDRVDAEEPSPHPGSSEITKSKRAAMNNTTSSAQDVNNQDIDSKPTEPLNNPALILHPVCCEVYRRSASDDDKHKGEADGQEPDSDSEEGSQAVALTTTPTSGSLALMHGTANSVFLATNAEKPAEGVLDVIHRFIHGGKKPRRDGPSVLHAKDLAMEACHGLDCRARDHVSSPSAPT